MSRRNELRALLAARPLDRALRVDRALLEGVLSEVGDLVAQAERTFTRLAQIAPTEEEESAARTALARQRRRWLRRTQGHVPLELMPEVERREALEDAHLDLGVIP